MIYIDLQNVDLDCTSSVQLCSITNTIAKLTKLYNIDFSKNCYNGVFEKTPKEDVQSWGFL